MHIESPRLHAHIEPADGRDDRDTGLANRGVRNAHECAGIAGAISDNGARRERDGNAIGRPCAT
jgi:hypothetical protein